ncbi:MAG: hypothetical protein D6677_02215 [Calditrichaeota bacterium]|nr:MAG: hypothetical protein D6677_02215 [Calditrichota bacterium]
MKRLYLVIIGDMVHSRKQTERSGIQNKFHTALGYTALKFADAVVSPPTLTIGDEFQAVLPPDGPLFDMLACFEFSMNYLPFRYGIGLGEISTRLNREAAIGMDGPAFYNARDALETARHNGFLYHFKGPTTPRTETVNLLLHWMSLERASWKLLKKKAYYLHGRALRQKDIAERLGITQPAVSKMIGTPGVHLFRQSLAHVEQLIGAMT